MQKVTPWQVLKSTISYQDQWLKLRTDQCRTSQGYIVETYHVLEPPAWVNVIALTASGQVVLVREYRHGIGQVLLGLPGGTMEPDEPPLKAVQRELLEETGYTAGQFFEIGHSYANPAVQTNTVWAFLAVDIFKAREQNLDASEDIEIVLQDFVEFYHQSWNGEIPAQALHLASLGFAHRFILQSKLPQLQTIRKFLLRELS
jgi:8-oxo-dGTP pyrophosphatase MutT (NUDIX family)